MIDKMKIMRIIPEDPEHETDEFNCDCPTCRAVGVAAVEVMWRGSITPEEAIYIHDMATRAKDRVHEIYQEGDEEPEWEPVDISVTFARMIALAIYLHCSDESVEVSDMLTAIVGCLNKIDGTGEKATEAVRRAREIEDMLVEALKKQADPTPKKSDIN